MNGGLRDLRGSGGWEREDEVLSYLVSGNEGGSEIQASDFLEPDISIIALQPLPAEGIEQRFVVGLRITNPNPIRVVVKGMSVRVELNDFPVLSGVSNEVPVLEPYGDVTTSITVGSDLINSLRLLASLINSGGEPISYEVEARVSVDSPTRRRLTLTREGQIPLQAEN